MQIYESLKPWLGRKSVQGALLILGIMLLVLFFKGDSTAEVDSTTQQKPVVTLTTPIEYAGGQSISVIGNVRAFSEAEITSESSGRVTSVNVSLGQQVPAGTIIATLENASERASVLQAEGVYEAALAGAEQTTLGVDQAETALRTAKNGAVSTFNSSYNTVNGAIRNSIDPFFRDPNHPWLLGLQINAFGDAKEVSATRIEYQDILKEWQIKTTSINTESDLRAELAYASTQVTKTVNFVNMFLILFPRQNDSNRYTEEDLISFMTSFTNLRSNLIVTQSSIDSAISTLDSAEDSLRQAKLSATGGSASTADAQVKQALGALRAAQANLAKTVLRTPVSGTVNSISVRTGDFINSFTPVAVVANNNALEVIAYISDSERGLLNIGDEVFVEGAYPGTVTHISPAVDSKTRKIEVRIATQGAGISNGDTVRITKEVNVAKDPDTTVKIPLAAVKFDSENGTIFAVEGGVLIAKEVTLGNIFGGSVEVVEGLGANDEFVLDARGLIAGSEVEVKE